LRCIDASPRVAVFESTDSKTKGVTVKTQQTGAAALRALTLASSFALLSACEPVDESSDEVEVEVEDEDEEAVGETQQAFSAWGGSGTRIAVGGDLNVPLGSATGTASFLMAIAGNIEHGSAIVSGGFGPGGDQVQLLISAGPGRTFRADAGIVYPGAHQYGQAFSTLSGTESRRMVSAGSSRRRCFLTYVCGGGSQFFNSADDYIAIQKKPDHLDGIGEAWYLTMGGSACGAASCMLVDEPDYWAAGGTGVYPLGSEDWSDGKYCWLTGVGGRFRENNASEGVVLRTWYGVWQLLVSEGHWGAAECAR
jgi:hypothetical protein